jgi:two-component system cell cycle sensor histidine kinase/response regulator CckA
LYATLNSAQGLLADEMIRKKMDRAEQFLDMAGTMIIALNQRGEVTLINKKGCQILEFSRDEILGRNWFDNFVPVECRERVREAFSHLVQRDALRVRYFENPVLTKSGEQRLIAWYNSVLVDEAGIVVGPLSSGEDVTECRKAEAALRQSEAKYRDLFDNTGEAIFVHDLQGKFLDVNQIACERLSYLKTELLAMSLESITAPEYVNGLLSKLEAVRQNGCSRFETCHLTKDGTPILVEITARGSLYDGQLAAISVARDISERKRIERALLESESRYRLLVDKSDQAILVLQHGVIGFLNDRFCRMLGASSSELVSTSFSDYVHPDDRVRVENLLVEPESLDGQTGAVPFKIVG